MKPYFFLYFHTVILQLKFCNRNSGMNLMLTLLPSPQSCMLTMVELLGQRMPSYSIRMTSTPLPCGNLSLLLLGRGVGLQLGGILLWKVNLSQYILPALLKDERAQETSRPTGRQTDGRNERERERATKRERERDTARERERDSQLANGKKRRGERPEWTPM